MPPLHPDAPLDYALFQLTPTRTRCDLLVFSGGGGGGSGGGGERIASGLLEPFLSHLKCARDQIPKGGYSITLRTSSIGGAPWFTKATLERFVRFVNTPDILERVDVIEREILQIECSVHSGNLAPSVASSLSGPHQTHQGCIETENGEAKKSTTPKAKVILSSSDAAQGVTSKFCLQRALETRKVVLQKEQGMAYARASVAGFELARIGDLLSFADAFGASRLREACLNFKDLCMKKEKDKHWMDELAKLEAFSQQQFSYGGASGVRSSEPIYAADAKPLTANDQLDSNCVAQDSLGGSANVTSFPEKNQDGNLHMPLHRDHQSQYLHDKRVPVDQQMPPYHGYSFPSMQFGSPYYPAHPGMPWSLYPEEFDHRISRDADRYARSNKSSLSKERSKNGKAQRSKQSSSVLQSVHSNDDLPNSGSESNADSDNDISADRDTVKTEELHMRKSKKNSRTVVIRNINYISSQRKDGSSDDSSAEGALIDGDFLRENVENVVDSLEKHQKSNRHKYKKNADSKNLRTTGIREDCSSDIGVSSVAKTCDAESREEGWQGFQNILTRIEESGYNDLEHQRNEAIIQGDTAQLVEGDEYCIISSLEPMKESVLSCLVDAESEKGIKQQLVEDDSVVITQRDVDIRDSVHMESFDCDENYCKSMKTNQNLHEDLLCMSSAKPEVSIRDALSDFTNEPSALRSQRGEDCLIAMQHDQMTNEQVAAECSIFDGDQAIPLGHARPYDREKDEKKVLMDESFIVPTRPTLNDQLTSQWKTDISIVSSIMLAAISHENESKDKPNKNRETLPTCEPYDLQMVLERDSRFESTDASWFPEICCNAIETCTNSSEQNCGAEPNGYENGSVEANCEETGKNSTTDTKNKRDLKNRLIRGYSAKSKPEVLSSRKPPTMSKAALQKTKKMEEEENRRRIEELLAERQKRIAERSGSSSIRKASTDSSTEPKVARGLVNHVKKSPPSAVQVINRSKPYKIKSG